MAVGRQGYYTRRTQVLLSAGDSVHVDAQLRPKAAGGGFLRSLIVPGWGQRFNERPGRGAFYTLAVIAAAGTTGYLQTRRNSAVDDYNALADSLAAATTEEEVQLYTRRLTEQDATIEQRRQDVRNAAIVTASVWVVNAIDALLFGPVREDLPGVSLEASSQPSGIASLSPAHARAGLVVRF